MAQKSVIQCEEGVDNYLPPIRKEICMIKQMHLKNIQSWKDETVNFSQDLNVITARSERGKTVLFKVFYQMVFPNKYKFSGKNSLIRRDSYYGEVDFILWNDTEIHFHLEDKSQYFKMKRICDDEFTVYYQNDCPQEIVNELGLVVDYELGYILNIYIKDNQYPLINTSRTWNAKLFNQVFTNPELDSAIKGCTDTLNELNVIKQKNDNYLRYLEVTNNQMKYIDIEPISCVEKILSEMNTMYNIIDSTKMPLNELEKYLTEYEKLKDKVFEVIDIDDIKNYFIVVRDIDDVLTDLDKATFMLSNIPDSPSIEKDLECVARYIELLENAMKPLSNLEINVARLEEIDEICNKFQEVDEDLESICLIFEKMIKVNELLNEEERALIKYAGAVKDENVINLMLNELDGIEEYMKSIKAIENCLIKQENLLLSYSSTLQTEKQLKEEFDEVSKNIEVCPTCGKPL